MKFVNILSVASLFLFVVVTGEVFFKEEFNDGWMNRWVYSEGKTPYSSWGKFVASPGKFHGDPSISTGLQTSQDARFYGISSGFLKSFTNMGKDLVLQFTVKFEQDIDCGGGYVKVLPKDLDQKGFNGESTYSIMFGPDICGSTKKVHVIFNYNGKNVEWKKELRCETDTLTHLYTLVVHPDLTYEVMIDQVVKESGRLDEDWDFLPAKEIPDPEQSKPEDWVDEKEIADPEDAKPEGWDDEPEMIPDPDAEQPEDWDVEEDGEWEPSRVPNPAYKGEWTPKMIPNPAYKGEWIHPMIPNPAYEEDANLYVRGDMGFVGIDIWQMKSGTIFDNIIVTDSLEEAQEFAAATFNAVKEEEKAQHAAAEEEKRKVREAEQKRLEEEQKAQLEAQAEASEEEVSDDEDEDDEGEDKFELSREERLKNIREMKRKNRDKKDEL
uniref:Calreticulin n=1 Tax=Stygiella incarcerata TaxID=1712417 RepID=A0A192ZIF5_9EUKA|nr:calreticulin [Stygiella incarcerata]|eukprot:TRINITY_DN81013_c0_g1_i1.p1 TRINITY_DN81013_c0_g1~~TRINITY_DN81013_c0_g1_i1.p1  ORF type:complete len:438 (+),score=148.12 TRINITY_DN81013_c0_g1_i1:107-1420(+)